MVHESLETTSEMVHKVIMNCLRSRIPTFERAVIELSPGYTPFRLLLLNCHQSTHLSDCCYWTVTRVHTFQRVVIELSPEYTPFSMLLLKCQILQTFQRVVIELTPEYTPFGVLLLNCHHGTHLSACCSDLLHLISHRCRIHRALSL